MSSIIPWPYQIARSRASYVDELLSIWPEPNGDERGQIADAEEVLREVLTLPELMRRGWSATLDRIVQGQVSDHRELGTVVLDLFGRCLRLMERIQRFASPLVRTTGQPLAGLDALASSLDAMKRLRDHAAAEWPRFDSAEARQRAEEVERDGGLTLDELFAGAAGVSREEWAQRVAAYEAARSGRGGA